MDKLEFLDGDAPADTTVAAAVDTAPTETSAPEPTSEPAPAEGPARGPDGKFVSKPADATASAPPQAPAAPPEVAQPQKAPDGYVPLAALEKLREELNSFKRQQQQQPPPPRPDPYEDFEAYEAWQEAQQTQERADWSRQLAEVKYGAETVSQAQQWAAERFNADPIFRGRALTSRDPYGFAIGEFQREQALQLLSDPKLLDQFRAWQAGTAQPAAAAPAVAPIPPSPTAPPPSITSAPSAGGVAHVPLGPGKAYGSVFD